MLHRIVVVGASLAGLRAAETLRDRGFDGELTLVGEEPHRPYDRPPLSKQVLQGTWEPEQTLFRRSDKIAHRLDTILRLDDQMRKQSRHNLPGNSYANVAKRKASARDGGFSFLGRHRQT